VKFQYIAEYRGTLTRGHLCRLMGVSERGLHAWKHRPPSHRQRRDMVLLAHIRDQHRLSLGSYGRPRMTEELNELGIRVGQRRVGRLMRQNGIQVIRSRKFKRTTDSDHAFNIAPNLLQQDFTASGPNQKWAGDITYVWTREGWVYLSVIIDLFSRRVVGWAISNRMKQDLALRALNMAIAIRRPPPGCIHHTDRGSQYCAHDYQKLLRKHGFKVSMSGKGNCYDNSAVEMRISELPDSVFAKSRTAVSVNPGQSCGGWPLRCAHVSWVMISGFSVWVNAGLALFLRMLSPFRSMRWALWMMRSRMASAMVGSPII
jgi:putative transposase